MCVRTASECSVSRLILDGPVGGQCDPAVPRWVEVGRKLPVVSALRKIEHDRHTLIVHCEPVSDVQAKLRPHSAAVSKKCKGIPSGRVTGRLQWAEQQPDSAQVSRALLMRVKQVRTCASHVDRQVRVAFTDGRHSCSEHGLRGRLQGSRNQGPGSLGAARLDLAASGRCAMETVVETEWTACIGFGHP